MADEAPLFSDEEIDAFLENVFAAKYRGKKVDRQRVEKYAGRFMEAVEKGLGVDYATEDAEFYQALKENVFHFSHAKNRAEIQSLSAALRDADGKLRSFSAFQREAAGILGEFQGTWLKTEYDMAIASSQMAAAWQRTPDESILVYRTVGDARVRESHRQLDGIAKPKSDPFWNTYYPPNGWKCRCDVQETTSGRISSGDAPAGVVDSVPPMFRANFAKEGWVFPPDHPYFKA